MQIFITVSASATKSVRKKSKTLKKKAKTTVKGKRSKKNPSFHNRSRKAQILYLKKHPKSKYTMDDVKPKSKNEEDEDKKVEEKVEEEKDTKVEEETSEPEEENVDENTNDQEEVAEEDTEDYTEEESYDVEEVEAAEKIVKGMDTAKKRANTIADKVARKADKDEVESALDDVETTRDGGDVDPEKRAKTLKLIGKIALGALVLAGGIALATQMGPVGLLMAKEFMAQLQWNSNSSDTLESLSKSERNKIAMRELTKNVIDFISDMDKDELLSKIKEAKTRNKS